MVDKARRMQHLTAAVFTEMDILRQRVEARGMATINLSIGSPDQPPAPHVQRALLEAASDPDQYGYALTHGLPEFRQAVTCWYQNRFGLQIDPDDEVLPLMGSQDGLGHIFLAYLNPGDYALIPDPGYPIYSAGVHLAGGRIYPLPLTADNGFLPRLADIPAAMARQAKILFLNYPSNPLAATADIDFFREAVAFAREYDLLICHDLAYSELSFDGYRPPSFLQVAGAKEVAIEFHSLSKTFNLAGCRLGFVVGNREAIAALACLKSNLDYGTFKPLQRAGIAALTGPQAWVEAMAATYARRRDVLVDGLRDIGWEVPKPRASMFVWAPLPQGFTSSLAFARELLERTGVVVVPGTGFGAMGEGYVRMALVTDEAVLRRAVAKIGAFL